MVLAATLADKPTFDKLWAYYKSVSTKNGKGLMPWKISGCSVDSVQDPNSASDGDLDAAMALVIANRTLGGGYEADARTLTGAILTHQTTEQSGRLVLKGGDRQAATDPLYPSYFTVAYYSAFATLVPEQKAKWDRLRSDSYTLISSYQGEMGGLVPEQGRADGSPVDRNYGYNSCRMPWRLATDFAWTGNPAAATALMKMRGWIESHGGVRNAASDKNSCFVGGFALASLSESQAKMDAACQTWLNGGTLNDDVYYQGTLRVLYMLLAGGFFSP
jgi:endo-1,4-beta-D-glucanase Y